MQSNSNNILYDQTYLKEIDKIIEKYKVKSKSLEGTISKEMLLEMLQLEEKIRLSQAYISECSRIKDEINGWLRLSGEIQSKVANKFGYNNPMTNYIAVNSMRRGHIIYSEDPRFREVSVYVRNNLATKGTFKINDKIKDVPIVTLDKKLKTLDSLLSNNKYNIIIASSETWQPFRSVINILQTDILERYSHIANIYFIYISEAHAADVWPIGLSAGVINLKHKNIRDRIQCAKNLKKRYSFKIPIVVDSMDNLFRDHYSSWPFRAFIVKDKKIKYISDMNDSQYDILDIYRFFDNN